MIDLGCGNGSLTAKIADLGYSRAVGVDSAKTGIQHAEQNSSVAIQFVPHDLSDPLPSELHHQFDVALAAEVVEHLFLPASCFAEPTRPLSRAVFSSSQPLTTDGSRTLP
ncbi:MAG: class I SAM-dependent methyltransferase [Kineosporiaceae bacterium]|nr:class I SAM-dependent methyltransferase [Kineosporiaceae bacterium]